MTVATKNVADCRGDPSICVGGENLTNAASRDIEFGLPYRVSFTLLGTSDLLFHKWDNQAVAEKAASKKGSKAKKVDNVESYVYRDENGSICLPGEYVRQSMIHSAKFIQDPRSPRKSAMDLYKAGIISLSTLASLGVKQWDYEDARRVTIQRSSGITRVRPAMRAGWTAEFIFMVNTPEYISADQFHAVLSQAGRLVGVGDFRPTFGRFQVRNLTVLSD